MTDKTLPKIIKLPTRVVTRVGTGDTVEKTDPYAVFEQQTDGSWLQVSKLYPHSTSAFAAMGRLYQKDVRAQDPEIKV